MPPRGRGRGRGGGRLANRGTTRGGNRVAKSAPRPPGRPRRNSSGNLNGHSQDRSDGDHVHAVFEPPGLLIIAGMLPEHFPDYDSDHEQGESDSHSDYGSATAKTPRKLTARERLQETEHASNPGNDDDWTETDVEIMVAPKTRGFYRPPPKREVVRKRVKKAESSRYGDAFPQLRNGSASEDASEDALPSRRSSQKSSHENADLPVIVEQEATDEDMNAKSTSSAVTANTANSVKKSRKDATPESSKPRPEIVDEGELSEADFPTAFLKKPPTPPIEKCDDRADWIMRKLFAPMGDPQAFVSALTKLDPSTRSTEVLYDLALNAQRAIKAWQDEYLELDQITAPKSNPPKKPLTGGRMIIDPLIYDDMLEADLYGYNYDSKKAPGMQDPFRQRAGGGKFVGGRELRQRRGRDVGPVELSEPDATDVGGYGTRRRRAAQQQNNNQLEVPPRGVKRVNSNQGSEVELPPRKRGRPSAAEKSLMQSRVRQLREESAARSTSSERDVRSSEPPRRRGRPPGSKNTMPRSDAGIKKGPRKPRTTSTQADGENASLDPAEAATPASGDDSMIVDDAAPASQVNGVEANASTGQEHSVTNGEPPAPPPAQTGTSASTPGPDGSAPKEKDPKKRVRSEKRSKSMTEWWAARKAKAAEDRKLQLAQQAEQDRIAEEQARAAHAAHQAHFPPQDARYWPQIAPQHQHQHHHHHHHQHHAPQSYQGPPPQTHPPPPPPPPPPFASRPQSQTYQQSSPQQGPPQQGPSQQGPPQHGQSQHGQSQRGPLQHISSQHQPPPFSTPQHFHSQTPPSQNVRIEPPNTQPPPPVAHPHGLHTQGLPPPERQLQQVPSSEQQHISVKSHQQGTSHTSQSSSTSGLPPILASKQPPHQPPAPQASFTSLPAHSPPQHVFQAHPTPSAAQAPAQYSPPNPQEAPNRQPSPLRRIINYVSDPSKAAQPAGPPYQSIMTPGATSPSIMHQGSQTNRPDSRGRSPPATAGSFMSAFHINNHTSRPPIPGTGSFRSETPAKNTFTNYTAPPVARQQGRMTGAQVQDLALAAVQPAQRKPLEDVLKEQRDWRSRDLSPPPPPPPPSGPRPLFKLQPAPLNGPPILPQPATSNMDHPAGAQSSHLSHHQDRGPTLPRLTQQSAPGPFVPRPSSAASRPMLGSSIAAILSHSPPSTQHAQMASKSTARQQLPPLMPNLDRDKLEEKSATSGPFGGTADRHRSISVSSQGPPLRFVDMHRGDRRGSSAGPAQHGFPPDKH
ncbi:uncharacterized protein PV09_00315 [Verruconis gallopava]|uniref:Uncharacterized protein n=1 Tax=Verruconis gallopava TaxID=253628 RepID=A0A0D2ASD2_9PEZI|nr:uncharacterized protein PV09_00315 [Verruconis gallopava]KIW09430.1 hypothetical protein PV09_00315 [Verruconis gallopava]